MRLFHTILAWILAVAGVTAACAFGYLYFTQQKSEVAAADSQPGHGHSSDAENTIEVSPQARLNLGLTEDKIQPIRLTSFTRHLTLPALVRPVPGKTHMRVVAPMTGVITAIETVQGESVPPEGGLFQLRLLHEDMVTAQTNYLKTLGELDVEKKEIARLEKLTKEGAIPGKLLLERSYAKHRLEALLKAYHESLILHGLSEDDVDWIGRERRLRREFLITAPSPKAAGLVTRPVGERPSRPPAVSASLEAWPVVYQIKVSKGDFVHAGDTLAELADYRMLYVQGRAFQRDLSALIRAKQNGWKAVAVFEGDDTTPTKVSGLPIVYIDHEIEEDSRAVYLYVRLPNEIVSQRRSADGRTFVLWRHLPGQRLQLLVPIEKWDRAIVLPVDAVANDGTEYCVFVENGSHFEKRPVHVLFRDQFQAVIANDGSVFPGQRVAMTGAHQLLIAIKNQLGGGFVDEHHHDH